MRKVVFACIHNAGRSQMAEALFNHHAAGRAQAMSAGTRPAAHMDRNVVAAMQEIGLDVSSQRPKALTTDVPDGAERIITMGCGEEGVCPAASVPAEDWGLADPEGQSMEKVRAIRDEIDARVRKLITEMKLQEEVARVGDSDRSGTTADHKLKEDSK